MPTTYSLFLMISTIVLDERKWQAHQIVTSNNVVSLSSPQGFSLNLIIRRKKKLRMKLKEIKKGLQGLIAHPNARLGLWFRGLTVIRESLNPPFFFVGIISVKHQLCGVYL